MANRRPLVVIRFDRPNVPYKEPLFTAATEALNRRPGAVFDIVSIVPQQGTPAQVALAANQSRRNAEQVGRWGFVRSAMAEETGERGAAKDGRLPWRSV